MFKVLKMIFELFIFVSMVSVKWSFLMCFLLILIILVWFFLLNLMNYGFVFVELRYFRVERLVMLIMVR